MRDFLTDFYNKVINFFQSEKVEGENTKETAKNRLKLVLMQDRSNLEPETMAQLREELIEVISKYIVIDKDALGLNLDGDGESMALMLNIPVIRAKKPEEIREALEAAAKQKAETETEETAEEETTEETEVCEVCGKEECDCDGEEAESEQEAEEETLETEETDEQETEEETAEEKEVSEAEVDKTEEEAEDASDVAEEKTQAEAKPKKNNKKNK